MKFVIALVGMLGAANAACSTNCVNSAKSQIDSQCGASNPQACQCQNYPAIMQCFQACTDTASRNEMNSVQGWVSNVCASANQNYGNGQRNQFVPIGGPTPTANNGLFAATTVGSELVVSASGTNIVVPFSGSPANTNVPVVGNLYSTYNLGSISIGYKTASMALSSRSSSGSAPKTGFVSAAICSIAYYLIH
ncbi:hypothetical protein DSO57_1020943 [Entomophthora muscae]|uniref:Uncharacterized protein n=2 Tax=Entomophthora muscae TaxID=34485 RepID=A0ACC2U1Y7_9FUNG|nr:hypothetical protein DSO57_1037397 [Entomophthora muscae]KAJ9080818.1 hypothetical protein DSO57_1020943 [Entomophthora muscae]